MLILEPGEPGALIPRSDRRCEHVRKILKKKAGDRLLAGIATDSPFGPAPGALGEAVVESLDERGLVLGFEAFPGAGSKPEPLAPLRLILGFPRPIQANRIFKDLASLGVSEILLTGTELGEKSYLESDFFKAGEFRRPLLEGAEQAANPRLPSVSTHWSLKRCLDSLEEGAAGAPEGLAALAGWRQGARLALHPGEGAPNLGALGDLAPPLTLAIGSERGWTEAEVALLEERGFRVAGLGRRILKTETAAVAAVALLLARLGRM